MASKRKVAKAAEPLEKLLPKMGLAATQAMVAQFFPESKARRTDADTIRICCPIHGETTPSCDLNTRTGRIKCYGCSYVSYSLFDFLKRSKGWSYKQSIEALRSYVNFRQLTDTATKEFTAQGVWEDATQFLCNSFNLHLQRLLSKPTNILYGTALYEVTDPTLHWLFTSRRRDKDLVHAMPYGVVPPAVIIEELLKELLDKEIVRREQAGHAYPDKDWREAVMEQALKCYGGIDSTFIHSVSYFTGKSFNQYHRIKCRKPMDDKSDGITVLPGRKPDESLGFFGLCTPRTIMRGIADTSSAALYVVEGENDALSLMEGIAQTGQSGIQVIASGGNANELDDLKHWCDVSSIQLIADEPEHGGGNLFIANRLGTAREIQVRVFMGWDNIVTEHHEVKDPDDLVQRVGFENAHKVFTESAAYLSAPQWAYNRVQADVDREVNRPEGADRLRATLAAVEQYGQCVQHPAELTQFVEQVSALTGIPQGEVRTAIASGKNDERAFILTLANQFLREFYPLYIVNGSKTLMAAHHRESKRTVDITLSDADGIAISIAQSNGSIYEWVRDKVGLPPFLNPEDPDAPNVTPEKTITPAIQQYLKLAMQHVVRNVPSLSKCKTYGAGYHLLPAPDTGEPRLYFNSNDQVFMVHHDPVLHKFSKVIALPGPADGTYLFDAEPQPWTTELTTVDDFMEGNDVSLDELHDLVLKCVDIVELGWRFQHQHEHATYAGWMIGAMPLIFAWLRKTLTHVSGQTHSGKTTLLSLFGAGGNLALRLVEFRKYLDNFSEAALTQGLKNTNILAIIDEFEMIMDGMRQSIAVEASTRLMRNAHSHGGVGFMRGSASGKAVTAQIHCAWLTAGITPFRMVQDENRRFVLETKRVDGHGDSALRVSAKYSPEDFRRIRRRLTLGAPKFHLLFQKHHEAVEREIGTALGLASYNVPPRTVYNMLPMLSLMSMTGENWQKAYRDLVEASKERVQSGVSETSAAILYERIFRSANVQTVMRGANDNFAKRLSQRVCDMLRNQLTVDVLNEAHCGVYVDLAKCLAVIDFVNTQGRNGLLETWLEYRQMTHRNLKQIADQHPLAIHTQDYGAMGIPAFVRSTGSAYNPDTISVFNIRNLIEEVQLATDLARDQQLLSQHARPVQGSTILSIEATNDQSAESSGTPSDPGYNNNI